VFGPSHAYCARNGAITVHRAPTHQVAVLAGFWQPRDLPHSACGCWEMLEFNFSGVTLTVTPKLLIYNIFLEDYFQYTP
jgi:hypothetical protein